jgi:hypothetical protein
MRPWEKADGCGHTINIAANIGTMDAALKHLIGGGDRRVNIACSWHFLPSSNG